MNSIKEIATKDWTGKTVQQVLYAVGRSYTEHLFIDNKPGSLTAVGFHYPDEGWLKIYVTEYQHIDRFNAERQWDLKGFLLEKVSQTEFEPE